MDRPLADSVHEKLIDQLHLYTIIGGMPEAVARYVQTRSLKEVAAVHRSLCQAFNESLAKYNRHVDTACMHRVFDSLPNQVGSQIKYSRLDPESRVEKIKRILQILEQALLVQPVRSASAHGLPLGSNASAKVFKCLFLDIGLMQHICGVDAGKMILGKRLIDAYNGSLAEQFVGQQILCHGNGSESGQRYYWSRDRKSSSAEIDYIIVRDARIIPIEVKAGPGGRLKSMQVFMREHPQCKEGYVLSLSNFRLEKNYRLRFVPLYALPVLAHQASPPAMPRQGVAEARGTARNDWALHA